MATLIAQGLLTPLFILYARRSEQVAFVNAHLSDKTWRISDNTGSSDRSLQLPSLLRGIGKYLLPVLESKQEILEIREIPVSPTHKSGFFAEREQFLQGRLL